MTDAGPKITMATNAPSSWPAVVAQPVPNAGVMTMQVAAALKEQFDAQGGPRRVRALMRSRMLDEGVLQIPIEVEDEGRRVAVFVFNDADEDSARAFRGVRAVADRLGNLDAVYYAPGPLALEGEANNVIRPFGADLFSHWKKPLPSGQYAMWWTADGEPPFEASDTATSLDRIFTALDGVVTYVLGATMRAIKAVDENTARVGLNEKEADIPIAGPEDLRMVLSFSREKGVRFLFHTPTTTPTQRDRFLRLFAGYAEQWREHATAQGFPEDPPEQREAIGWWTLTHAVAKQQAEKDDPVQALGMMNVP